VQVQVHYLFVSRYKEEGPAGSMCSSKLPGMKMRAGMTKDYNVQNKKVSSKLGVLKSS